MNTIKKNISKLVVAASLIFSMSACSDKLSEPVYDFATQDFYSSVDRFRMGVIGARQMFSTQNTYGWYWMAFDNDTDISFMYGPGVGSNNPARDLGHYFIEPTHKWVEEAWGEYYKGISRANILLDNMSRVQVSSSEKEQNLYKQLVAETRAYRAMAYFDLVRLYGDIPLVETGQTVSDNFEYVRDPKEEVYDFICTELETAVKDLPWHDEYNAGYNGDFSKGAALGLLARVYLFRGGWALNRDGEMARDAKYLDYYAKANEHLDVLINSGKHSLNTSYEKIFRNICEMKLDAKENLYEVPFYNTTGLKAGSSQIGSYNGVLIPKGSEYGRANAYIRTHKKFAETFAEGDTRKEISVADWKYVVKDSKASVVKIPVAKSYDWTPAKFRKDWYTGPIQDLNNTNMNWVLIRYSDVLLMKAEVMNELNGPTAEALEPLNMVRRRAFGKDINAASDKDLVASNFTKESLFDEIVAERARELCFEGVRRLDLIRWNKLATAIETTSQWFKQEYPKYTFSAGIYFQPNKHELYPIPFREITESQDALKQNPGY